MKRINLLHLLWLIIKIRFIYIYPLTYIYLKYTGISQICGKTAITAVIITCFLDQMMMMEFVLPIPCLGNANMYVYKGFKCQVFGLNITKSIK